MKMLLKNENFVEAKLYPEFIIFYLFLLLSLLVGEFSTLLFINSHLAINPASLAASGVCCCGIYTRHYAFKVAKRHKKQKTIYFGNLLPYSNVCVPFIVQIIFKQCSISFHGSKHDSRLYKKLSATVYHEFLMFLLRLELQFRAWENFLTYYFISL